MCGWRLYRAAEKLQRLKQRLHHGADTHCISDIDNGKLPEWEKKSAPDIAKWYWKMPEVGVCMHIADKSTLPLCHAWCWGQC